jgi:fatty acid desaturase
MNYLPNNSFARYFTLAALAIVLAFAGASIWIVWILGLGSIPSLIAGIWKDVQHRA